MLNYPSINVGDLILDSPTDADYKDIYELFSDNEHCKYFRPKLKDEHAAKFFLKELSQDKDENRTYSWGIYEAKKGFFKTQKGKMIGLIIWERRSKLFILGSILPEWSLGIIINSKYCRKGIAAISVKTITQYLLNNNFRVITGWTNSYNLKSISLFKKLDYKFIGITDDSDVVFYKTQLYDYEVMSRMSQVDGFAPFNFSPHSNYSTYINAFSSFPILESENLILRPFRRDDINIYHSFFQERDIASEFRGNISLNDARNLITLGFPKDFLENTLIEWAIYSKTEKKIVGLRECFIDSPHHPVVMQGFITKSSRNKGYHQESLNVVISFIKTCGFNSMTANTDVRNNIARHILTKYGFIQTAQMLGRCVFTRYL